jgi:hypothetical protein
LLTAAGLVPSERGLGFQVGSCSAEPGNLVGGYVPRPVNWTEVEMELDDVKKGTRETWLWIAGDRRNKLLGRHTQTKHQ